MTTWLPAGLALSRMRPYSIAVCIVRTNAGAIGVAKSDPYLSTATPIAALQASPLASEDLRSVLQGLPIGAFVLGLPVCGTEGFAAERRALAQSVLHTNGASTTAACCMWDRRLAAGTVLDKCATSVLWEAVDHRLADAAIAADRFEDGLPCPLPPELDAAIALQDCLDEEMGGWPNTFG